MSEMLSIDFMQRALLAALLVGLSAPRVGVFLVQRRLALIGDGMGHGALAGVGGGVWLGKEPVWTSLMRAVPASAWLSSSLISVCDDCLRANVK